MKLVGSLIVKDEFDRFLPLGALGLQGSGCYPLLDEERPEGL